MKSNEGVSHFAFQLGAGNQGCHGIDYQDVNGTTSYQHFADLECLFTRIGLGNQKGINVHTQVTGVLRVHRMFGVNERSRAPFLLSLGNGMQCQGRLPARLGTINLDHSTSGIPADSQRRIRTNRTGRDHGHSESGSIAQFHDRAFSELALDLTQRHINGPLLVLILISHTCCTFPTSRSADRCQGQGEFSSGSLAQNADSFHPLFTPFSA